MNCPFCDIETVRNPIIKEGKFVVVIFSNPRLMPGHLLVIPKRHVEKISELESGERQELFDTAVEFQEKILSRIASGCDMRQNYRPFQKQDNVKVNHLHIHLHPRELFDNLYQKSQIFETDIFEKPSNEECERILDLLVQ